MSRQPMLWDIPSATGSPASASGATPSGLPDGTTTVQSGPAPAHVLPLAQRAKGKGLQMLVTSGLSGIASSASAALQSSLESKLLPRLDTAGSTLFVETWKRRSTPLRRRYWEHTASARPIDDSGFTSLPTPRVKSSTETPESADSRGERPNKNGDNLDGVAMLASVPTPQASDMTGGGQAKRAMESKRPSGAAASANLNDYVMLASVPTPMMLDHSMTNNPRTDGGQQQLPNVVALAAVPTPNAMEGGQTSRSGARKGELLMGGIVQLATITTPAASDGERGGTMTEAMTGQSLTQKASLATVDTPRSEDSQCAGAHRGMAETLHSQANLSAISTPSAREFKDTSGMSESGVDPDGSIPGWLDQLPRQAQLAASGPTAIGGTAAMTSSGQLDPEYSRWLMGLPTAWSSCADTEIQSFQKPRRRS